jgi:hypothetical protein
MQPVAIGCPAEKHLDRAIAAVKNSDDKAALAIHVTRCLVGHRTQRCLRELRPNAGPASVSSSFAAGDYVTIFDGPNYSQRSMM